MACAVWGNSRSAVISGPRSERASTVRRRRRKLSLCNATRWMEQNQSRKRVTRTQLANLLVSLVHKHRAKETGGHSVVALARASLVLYGFECHFRRRASGLLFPLKKQLRVG